MFRFKVYKYVKNEEGKKFQYILCFGSSLVGLELGKTLFLCFNTSYVSVQGSCV